MPADRPAVSRRTVVRAGFLGVAALVGGCSATPSTTPTASTEGSRTTPSPTPSPTPSGSGSAGSPTSPAGSGPSTPSALPTPSSWSPDANEIQPAVKQVAVDVVTAVLGYPAGGGGAAAARARVAALGQEPALVDATAVLVSDADAAVVEVVDAQYGGILPASASVLVVCRQWTHAAGSVSSGGTTVDVRLVKASPRWRVTELHPASPGAAASVSAAARSVLQSSQILLPPAAAADIRSGQVHDSVLATLLALSQTYHVGVSVVRSGHPTNVFGTTRPSDHPRGRAFDTWQIDGHAVVDATTPRSLVIGYMQRVAALGSYNVGGPYPLAGASFFSDDTHHDHVHAGFTI